MDTNKEVKPFIYDMDYVREQSSKNLFNVVSLFAGGGGSSTGYRLAGGRVLLINEFVEAARDVYRANYPDTIILPDDIRNITGKDILDKIGLEVGELDILDGSPPCASFSMAGLREKGWGKEKKYSDTKQVADDLFYEYARIVRDIQPKVFIAENVKGITIGSARSMLGSDQLGLFGEHKNTIYHTLVDCGYNVRYKVLNAKHYGVPQSRQRTIFIGVRNDINIPITYPKKSHLPVTVGCALADLIIEESEKRIPNQDTDTYKLWPHVKVGDSFEEAVGALFGRNGWFSKQKLDPDKQSPTLTTKYADFWHWSERRTLTIKEVIRLTSLPDNFNFCTDNYGKNFERCGRMVPPLMMKAIAEHVYNSILVHQR